MGPLDYRPRLQSLPPTCPPPPGRRATRVHLPLRQRRRSRPPGGRSGGGCHPCRSHRQRTMTLPADRRGARATSDKYERTPPRSNAAGRGAYATAVRVLWWVSIAAVLIGVGLSDAFDASQAAIYASRRGGGRRRRPAARPAAGTTPQRTRRRPGGGARHRPDDGPPRAHRLRLLALRVRLPPRGGGGRPGAGRPDRAGGGDARQPRLPGRPRARPRIR